MYESGFGRSYLEEIDFTYAVFSQCSFIRVNLSRAIFRNATLGETYFDYTNLSYADLRGIKRFNEVSFNNVVFCETIMPDGTIRTDSI
jgi:uncharacterized protein YjbI with pentapeptide repeats